MNNESLSQENPSSVTATETLQPVSPDNAAAANAEEKINWPEDLSVSQQAQTAFLETARALDLSVQQAQQLVDLEARLSRDSAQEQIRHQQEQVRQWGEQLQQFYGPRWEEAVSLAVRAADTFGGPELRALLEETGLGNHPVIVRTFNEIGKRISEDFSAGGSESSGADKTFAEALYGTMKKGE